jgi:hypothetical protein
MRYDSHPHTLPGTCTHALSLYLGTRTHVAELVAAEVQRAHCLQQPLPAIGVQLVLAEGVGLGW